MCIKYTVCVLAGVSEGITNAAQVRSCDTLRHFSHTHLEAFKVQIHTQA